MKVTLGHVAFAGAGYYLGAKAGRERYEEINQRLREADLPGKLRAAADEVKRSLGRGGTPAARADVVVAPPDATVAGGAALVSPAEVSPRTRTRTTTRPKP